MLYTVNIGNIQSSFGSTHVNVYPHIERETCLASRRILELFRKMLV